MLDSTLMVLPSEKGKTKKDIGISNLVKDKEEVLWN